MTEGTDMIEHPPHYTHGGDIECIDAIAAMLGRDGFVAYLRGQVVKYAWRMKHKGQTAMDAGKMAWYAARLKEVSGE